MARPTLKELSPKISEVSQRAQWIRSYVGTHGKPYGAAGELDELERLARARSHCQALRAHLVELERMIDDRRIALAHERSATS